MLEIQIPVIEAKLLGQDDSNSTDPVSDDEDDNNDIGKSNGENSTPSNRGLPINQEVLRILEKLNSRGYRSQAEARKIFQLYTSLCSISLRRHPCLGYVGTWVLWEIIGKAASGDRETNSFKYLECELETLYKQSRKRQKFQESKIALNHIHDEGNQNKHSDRNVAESADLLRNKMEILDDFLLEMVKRISKNIEDKN